MVQSALGKAVGLTTQQIQKYECGLNRISASRLYDFACVLNVRVNYFFLGLDNKIATGAVFDQTPECQFNQINSNVSLSEEVSKFEFEHEDKAMGSGEMMANVNNNEYKKACTIMNNYLQIENQELKEAIFKLMKLLSKISN